MPVRKSSTVAVLAISAPVAVLLILSAAPLGCSSKGEEGTQDAGDTDADAGASDGLADGDASDGSDAGGDDCEPDCQDKQCGPNGCGDECGSCQPPQECAPDGRCQDPAGPRILQCDAQNAYAGWPMGIHCEGEDAQGDWLMVYELVSSTMDGAFLEGNAVLSNLSLTPDDVGPYHFEVLGRDAHGNPSPIYPVDILVERYSVRLSVLHDTGSTGMNFPNALYEILGTECAFNRYQALDQLELVPGGSSVSLEVSDESEPDMVACMIDLLAALPVERPEVWIYAKHYGTTPVTDHLWRVVGFTFWVSDEFVAR